MVVFVFAAIMMAMAAPKLRDVRDRSNLRAAKDQVASMVAAARASAIQKGRTARVSIKADTFKVLVDTNATPLRMTVVAPRPIKTIFSLTSVASANAADTVITFDSRGLGSTGSGLTARFRFTGPAGTDSVCVSRYGLIMKKGCF